MVAFIPLICTPLASSHLQNRSSKRSICLSPSFAPSSSSSPPIQFGSTVKSLHSQHPHPLPAGQDDTQLNRRAFLHRASTLFTVGLAASASTSAFFSQQVLADTSNDGTTNTPKMSQVEKIDVTVGTGSTPKTGDKLYLHYVLTLNNFQDQGGQVVDSSRSRGKYFSYAFDKGQVIKGWDQGVSDMKVGGRRRIIVPSQLGYGAAGAGGVIPPNATLFFDIELVRIE